jgi:uncharacterized surface protein with fasciclin (FAS1) repeats
MLSIYERLLNTPELATFVTGIQIADLHKTITGDGSFTIFAPNNRAFTSLSTLMLQRVSQDLAFLTRVVSLHILNSLLEHQYLVDMYDRGHRNINRTSIDGTQLNIDLRDGIKIDDATVLSVDSSVSNGIIYPIDRVLLPHEFTQPAENFQIAALF